MQSNSFTGRLTRSPSLLQGKKEVCTFCVAESESSKGTTAFLTFAAFGRLADYVKNLGAGDLVAVQFLISNYRRVDGAGTCHYSYNLNATRVELLKSNKTKRDAQGNPEQAH